MSDEIKVASLTTFEVAPDGTTLRMGVINSDGNPASVVLPSTCLNRLLMTLPDMMYRSLRARFQDNSLRVVFPAQTWRLERSAPGGQFILTLATFGGFEASFGFDDSGLRDLAGALADRRDDEFDAALAIN
jgi:hypothetical protein